MGKLSLWSLPSLNLHPCDQDWSSEGPSPFVSCSRSQGFRLVSDPFCSPVSLCSLPRPSEMGHCFLLCYHLGHLLLRAGSPIPWLFNESFSFSSQPLKLPTPQSVRAGLDGVGKSPVSGLLQALTFLTRNEILW